MFLTAIWKQRQAICAQRHENKHRKDDKKMKLMMMIGVREELALLDNHLEWMYVYDRSNYRLQRKRIVVIVR